MYDLYCFSFASLSITTKFDASISYYPLLKWNFIYKQLSLAAILKNVNLIEKSWSLYMFPISLDILVLNFLFLAPIIHC